ncbi:MAG TPA: TonB-dependent receptor [Chthoniobacterales bacterium]|nr:TonB-dependent receptor [Chthoniobacterales bacterium]
MKGSFSVRVVCRVGSILLSISLAQGQEATTERITVRADRLPDVGAAAPFNVEVVTREEIESAPQLRLDDLLRGQVPGFSLFRRSSSRAAHPTTQGVTLRNFGPSGAGRTLVLLDGIPLNDPFAGYVLWNQAPPASLENILVQPGGGAGLFGNAALAGTIFLVSKQPEEKGAFAEASLGNYDTYSAATGGNLVRGRLALSGFAERFSTSGYPVLRADQRGPVDNTSSADSSLLQVGAEFVLTPEMSLRFQARRFEENRGNGTIFTRNDTLGSDVSAVLTARFPAASSELQVSAYGQRRKFRSTFSSVNAARDIETPALYQYDVPANAAGGSAVWTMALGAQHRVTFGGDFRWIEGETNEAFRWDGTEFTRLRNAGGRQFFTGAFVEDVWNVSDTATLTGGFRIDRWQLFDGMRRESERGTGAIITDSRFADRNGYSLNGRLGTRVALAPDLSVRAAGYTGFRVPTLNELYRPFRVGNDVTEANAALEPERLLGVEAGFEWRPIQTVRLAVTGFFNRLEDAIGNITIGAGPGTFEPGGFIPAGGILRQRRNIELVLAPGLELSGQWQIAPTVLVKAGYLFTEPTIEKASEFALEGKMLAQTPQHVFTGGLEWTPSRRWLFTAQIRTSSGQFEDDLNTRVLAPFTTIDAAIFYNLSDAVTAGVKVENLFDTEIETGKSADGLVSIGAPRLMTLQLRWRL